MKNIYFFKPIILEKALADMDPIQQEDALRFLHGKQFLTVTGDGVGILYSRPEDGKPIRYFYGSEAAMLYRQSLGLPDVSIRMLDVNSILSEVPDFDALRDISALLKEIDFMNKHARCFLGREPDDSSAREQYLELQELVECLEDNAHRAKPLTREYMLNGDMDDSKSEPATSLRDLGLSLLPVAKDDARPSGEAHRTPANQLLHNIFGENLGQYDD